MPEDTSNIKLFVAAKAFIVRDGKVLVVREQASADGTRTGYFQIPGGRCKPGERFDAGLLREVREEIDLEVTINDPLYVQEWRPVVRGDQWQIVAIFFECSASGGEITLSDEHDAYEWIDPASYASYKTVENEHPVFEAYLKRHKLS